MIKIRPLCLLLMTTLFSCVNTNGGSKKGATGRVDNSSSSVSTGYGRILSANPIIISGNPSLSPSSDVGNYLSPNQDFIVNGTFLIGPCTDIVSCITVKEKSNSNIFQSTSKKWAFDTSTSEFSQVNLFGHMNRHQIKFQTDLNNFYSLFHVSTNPNNAGFLTSIPSDLFLDKAHWNSTRPLTGYSDSPDFTDNAAFVPSKFEIAFGSDSTNSNVKFSHDPSVIYHEMGHAFNYVLMNMRNIAGSNFNRSDLGSLFYDEAGAIGEGVADFYSYYMNGRTHIGEWALGIIKGQSRPLSERDSLHATGISTASDSRLSYPTFLTYDPNRPTEVFEDIHYAGQIISHFLVAMAEDLITSCSMDQATAITNIHYMLIETFAELGDLTTLGHHGSAVSNINLNTNNANLWLSTVNPVNYRKFAQTFARKFRSYYSVTGRTNCNGGTYSQDKLESMLDQYGLLLFKTYNSDGSGSVAGHLNVGTLNQINVNPANRIKTELLSKDLLTYELTAGAAQAYVFDDRSQIVEVIQSMQSSGQLQDGGVSDQIQSNQNEPLPYNNGNSKISPGEVVGIMLNLYNNSNSTMGGVQVLANDWDHFNSATNEPCNTGEDSFPTTAEGGSAAAECSTTTSDNGDTVETIRPICFIEATVNGATKWIGQEEYRAKIGLATNKCLRGASSTHDCFLRALKGADQATFSKIDPNKTWAASLADSSGAPQFQVNNITFFEVSKDIPPGTKFNCRFRARFGNCDDCYHDSTKDEDDFLDMDYSGSTPFKLFNLQFTVTD